MIYDNTRNTAHKAPGTNNQGILWLLILGPFEEYPKYPMLLITIGNLAPRLEINDSVTNSRKGLCSSVYVKMPHRPSKSTSNQTCGICFRINIRPIAGKAPFDSPSEEIIADPLGFCLQVLPEINPQITKVAKKRAKKSPFQWSNPRKQSQSNQLAGPLTLNMRSWKCSNLQYLNIPAIKPGTWVELPTAIANSRTKSGNATRKND